MLHETKQKMIGNLQKLNSIESCRKNNTSKEAKYSYKHLLYSSCLFLFKMLTKNLN